METATLHNVFLQSQENLRESLRMLKLPRDYATLQMVVNAYIEKLLTSENAFSRSLNSSDAEMLSYALRMALSFQKLTLTDSVNFKSLSVRTEYKVENPSNENSTVVENALSVLPTIICAYINPWLAALAGIGTIGYKEMRNKSSRKPVVNIKEYRNDISREITNKEIQTIMSGIESLCKEID